MEEEFGDFTRRENAWINKDFSRIPTIELAI
jgi:hypothetical protein